MAQGVPDVFQHDQYVGTAAAITWAAALNYASSIHSMTKRPWSTPGIRGLGGNYHRRAWRSLRYPDVKRRQNLFSRRR